MSRKSINIQNRDFPLDELKSAFKFNDDAFGEKRLTMQNLKNVQHYSYENNEMMIYESKSFIYFVFAPTNDFNDWIYTNLKQEKKTIGNYQVHTGFAEGAKHFFPTIKDKITNADPKKVIRVTGFSLGAALATEASRFITEILKKKCRTILFASPRVGGEKYANKLKNSDLLTICHVYFKRDIVPKVPLKKRGYCHINQNNFVMKSKFWHWIPLISLKIKLHKSYSEILDY